jgi:hypothetical protein
VRSNSQQFSAHFSWAAGAVLGLANACSYDARARFALRASAAVVLRRWGFLPKAPCASSRRASATRGPNHRCHHAVLEALSRWHFDAVIASSSASTPSARCRPPAPRRVRHVAAARAPAAVRPLPSRSSPRPLPCIISHSSTSDDLARHASVSHVDLSPTPLLPATSCVRFSPLDLHWPCVVAT